MLQTRAGAVADPSDCFRLSAFVRQKSRVTAASCFLPLDGMLWQAQQARCVYSRHELLRSQQLKTQLDYFLPPPLICLRRHHIAPTVTEL